MINDPAGFLWLPRLVHGPWQALERGVARLLPLLGFEDVRLIGATGDRGADLLARRAGAKWVFQAKFTVGRAAPREALSDVLRAVAYYGADRGVAVSNRGFSPALVAHRDAVAAAGGPRVDLWDGATLGQLAARADPMITPAPTPRPYQADAIRAVLAGLPDGSGRALLVLATGLGKTFVAAEVVRTLLAGTPMGNAVVLAHTKELVEQLERAFWPHLPKTLPTSLLTGEESPRFLDGVLFSTIQSALQRANDITGLRPRVVVIDEAHHVGAQTFRVLLDSVKPRAVVGLTATPWRGDNYDLSSFFGRPAFTMGIAEGIGRGFLAAVDYRLLVDDINWDVIPRLSRRGMSIRDLNRELFLPARDDAIATHVVETWNRIRTPRAIVFCPTVEHAVRMAGTLRSRGLVAHAISAELPRSERTMLMSRFRDGEIQALTAVDVLNEGVDVPDVNLIAFCRVTHSRRIFVQQLGRGLRLRQGKDAVVVLDFVSDIRRIAALIELDRERTRYTTESPEILMAPSRVTFSVAAARQFFEEWLQDVTNVADSDDAVKLDFPPPLPGALG